MEHVVITLDHFNRGSEPFYKKFQTREEAWEYVLNDADEFIDDFHLSQCETYTEGEHLYVVGEGEYGDQRLEYMIKHYSKLEEQELLDVRQLESQGYLT